MLYLHLYDVFGDPNYLQMAHGYVKQSLNSLSKHSITFLCGDGGPLAVAAVVHHKMNNEKQAEDPAFGTAYSPNQLMHKSDYVPGVLTYTRLDLPQIEAFLI